MLQKLRDQTQSTGFKILVGAIIVVLTLFGFGATNLFLGGDPDVATVGDMDITQALLDVETERERRRLLAQMGPEFDPSAIDRLQLQRYVLNQLISRQVLYQAAKELGVQVPPEQTNEELVNNPNYQVDGRFDQDLYLQSVDMLGYSPTEFMAEVSNALSSDQLRLGLTESEFVTGWELAEAVRVITQKRDIAYLPLSIDSFSEGIVVTDEEVATRYEEEQASYTTELGVDVAYLSVSVDDLVNDESIEIPEDELEEMYEQDKVTSALDDQRDSSHILVQINDDRDEAQARELITEIAARLTEGEEFAALAAEFSEDPGSREQGGSLGPVGKGVFDPAFEEALWALDEPGAVSEPVKSSFGYHLIRLDEIVETEYPSFADQRDDLETRLRRTRAQELLDERALELERTAYDERYALTESAEILDLEIKTVTNITRSDPGDVDELFRRVDILDMIFSDEILEGENSGLIELDDRVVVLRVENKHEPEPIPLEAVADVIKDSILREKALIAIEEAQSEALARLESGDNVSDIADNYGAEWQSFEAVTRTTSEDIPDEVLRVAFELPRPPAGKKAVGQATLPDGAALITVTRVQPGDVLATTDAELDQLEQGLQNRARQLGFTSFFRAAESEVGVTQRTGAES